MKPQEMKLRFVELRAAGRSFASIASELQVSKSTVLLWSKDLTEQVNNMRAIETDNLIDSLRIGKEHRLQLLGGLLEKLRDQILSRDFSDVPSEKLVELTLKVTACLDQAVSPPQFTETQMKTDGECALDLMYVKQTDKWSA